MDNVNNDIQEFHTLHPHKKLKVLGIIAIIFLVSVGLGIYIARKGTSQAPNTDSAAEKEAGSNLTIVPEAATLAKGATMNVSVNIASTPSQATDVVITFDPKLVKVSEIVNGDVFPDILRSEITEGQIVVSAAVDPNAPSETKTGTIFSFTVSGVSAGAATFSFDKDMTITATNGVNTLGTAEPVTITVQ